MKAKHKKLDLRLSDELSDWIEKKADEKTLSKSSYARMILEEARRAQLQTAEDPQPYHRTGGRHDSANDGESA